MTRLEIIQNKILPLETVVQRANMWRLLSQTIVFTNGCFDLLHRGHLHYLAEAREKGHALVIGLNSDASVQRLKGPSRPILPEADRAFHLAALAVVDAVCIFDEETPLNLISLIRPDVLVKGGDYTPDGVVGREVVESSGGRVEIIPFLPGYSTTSLIERLKNG